MWRHISQTFSLDVVLAVVAIMLVVVVVFPPVADVVVVGVGHSMAFVFARAALFNLHVALTLPPSGNNCASTHAHTRSFTLTAVKNCGWRMANGGCGIANADFTAVCVAGARRCRRYAAAGEDNGPKSPSLHKKLESLMFSQVRE